jgi:hypothetical protein
MEHFLACTRGETECIVPGADGTSVTAAIVAAQTSLARGGAVVDMAEILST